MEQTGQHSLEDYKDIQLKLHNIEAGAIKYFSKSAASITGDDAIAHPQAAAHLHQLLMPLFHSLAENKIEQSLTQKINQAYQGLWLAVKTPMRVKMLGLLRELEPPETALAYYDAQDVEDIFALLENKEYQQAAFRLAKGNKEIANKDTKGLYERLKVSLEETYS